MHMVGHQRGSVKRATRFAQPVQIAEIVVLAEEARLAVVAALDDVQRNTVEVDARAAEHATNAGRKSSLAPLLL